MKLVEIVFVGALLGCGSAETKVVVVGPPATGGVGIQFHLDGGQLGVDKLVADGPAANAGVTYRDSLFAIDGVPTKGLTVTQVAQLVAGPIDSPVVLNVGQNQESVRDVTITRKVIPFYRLDCQSGDCAGGTGVSIDTFAERYEGAFAFNRYNGQGKLVSPSGRTYEGAFVDGQPSGQGVAVDMDGVRIEGLFDKGEPAGDMKVTYPDGIVYEGALFGHTRHGVGKLTNPNGDVSTGVFDFGKLVEGTWLHHPANGDGRSCVRNVTQGQVATTGIITYSVKDPKKRITFDGPFGDDCVASGDGLMTYKGRKMLGMFEGDEPGKGVKLVK